VDVGLFTAIFHKRPFEETLDLVRDAGVTALQLAVNGPHCNADALLSDDAQLAAFRRAIDSRGLYIDTLACHGNGLHPNQEIANAQQQRFRTAVLLAEKLGVDTIVDFSGCPGGNETDTTPNWVTCPWPTDFSNILTWQWDAKLIPYWKEHGGFARQHGIRVAIELHPGFCVYSPENMLRLREAVGDVMGANFDPSHLFWQGVDNVHAIRYLGDAIYSFHAKDTGIDEQNTKRFGVLDTKTYADVTHRAWVFRTVGYGHGEETWRNIISALRLVGFKKALVIEHEDALMSQVEGFRRAADLLNRLTMREDPAEVTWA